MFMDKYWGFSCYNPRLIMNFVYPICNIRDVLITGDSLVVNLEVLR